MKTGGRLSKLINMKTIVLLRHGESTWNRENRFTGWTDVDLTELGIQEANHAGDLLKDREWPLTMPTPLISRGP